MIVLQTIQDVLNWRKEQPISSLGFVPTMGALHQGHLSLVDQSLAENDTTIVSIFVNPTQFNDVNDFNNYPHTIEKDMALLRDLSISAVFIPSVAEMYPEIQKESFYTPILTETLEAKMRPGHFDGVITIIRKLFDLVQPHKVYLGEKDFQQLSIISAWVKKESRSEIIVPCPTLREANGLAMSSRNVRLTELGREKASLIYHILKSTKEQKHLNTPPELEIWARSEFALHPEFELEYFEIIDAHTFAPLADWEDSNQAIAVTAAFIEGVRLIDNLRL
jgi:pantoate--beta-alanine ligase